MNCLVGALMIRHRIGGRLMFRMPTVSSPWGHWWVERGGRRVSWSATDRDLVWWHQLWFEGHVKSRRPAG